MYATIYFKLFCWVFIFLRQQYLFSFLSSLGELLELFKHQSSTNTQSTGLTQSYGNIYSQTEELIKTLLVFGFFSLFLPPCPFPCSKTTGQNEQVTQNRNPQKLFLFSEFNSLPIPMLSISSSNQMSLFAVFTQHGRSACPFFIFCPDVQYIFPIYLERPIRINIQTALTQIQIGELLCVNCCS